MTNWTNRKARIVREFLNDRAEKGAAARAARLTSDQKRAIAQKAANARWAKYREEKGK